MEAISTQVAESPQRGTSLAEPPLIDVQDLWKEYDGKVVLRGIDLHVDRGEALVVVGYSGSGKSVLMRNIVGLERPTSGRVLVGGVDTAAIDDRSVASVMKRFGIVFQKNALFDSLSVFDNVAYPLREERCHEHEIHERVLARLTQVDLADALDKMPAEISGGMAKRVAIARALVTDPEIIVYDEPTAGLDPQTSRHVDDLIEKTRRDLLVTSLIVTHDVATAISVGDRIALIDDGVIVFESPVESVFDSSNVEVQQFLAASAVDQKRLLPRHERSSPAQLRAAWSARPRSHARGAST